ncbi:hypothetical protein DAERI_010047 [Deinococcus aerius]|uniref:Glyoxalase-related protein domain-containing protein n=1 Tax=Deinococcus aerius TaxID=200253 RepID=A0A2I9DU85_9DEIO|nr:glyoxalase superfamily protein [Deinococcus aerius]GBF03875.1 hypothetical protein DAERI_010047 [Deinococcus aerius]
MNEWDRVEQLDAQFKELKRLAGRLKTMVRAFGLPLRQYQALDLVAVAYGYESWQVLCGRWNGSTRDKCDLATLARRVQRAMMKWGLNLDEKVVRQVLIDVARPAAEAGVEPKPLDAGVVRRLERARARRARVASAADSIQLEDRSFKEEEAPWWFNFRG